MNRNEMMANLLKEWDFIIIGGGASGLGAAVDAASRGFKTLLLEQSDFAKATSSRSTKLIHGGLRYLKQGHLSLVIEALKERGLLCENAPHLVSPLGFLVPSYHWWEKPFYWIGLKLYDLLAGKWGLKGSHAVSRDEVLRRLPTLVSRHLRGGSLYYDGQFDDARLAITLAQTTVDQGGVPLNYMRVESFLKEGGQIVGVNAIDTLSHKHYSFRAKVIINATGVFTDQMRKLDQPQAAPMVAPSQGIHLVLDRSFLPSDIAILIPQTEDGRVLFFIPWHHHLLIGTTDTPVKEASLEPKPLDEEIDYLLKYAGHYLTRKPTRADIRSVFAGLRPLVKVSHAETTASIPRDHVIQTSASGLITICGGKWTTYRKMAQDLIDKAIEERNLSPVPCKTKHLRLHGYTEKSRAPIDSWVDSWALYGSDGENLEKLIQQHPEWGRRLHPRLPYLPVEVIWAVREEMALTLEDVLARRTRALFLDVEAALEMAPQVAALMAQELGHPPSWEKEQVAAFALIAKSYF